MKTKKLPSKEYLDECLDYNQETGDFTWKQRPLYHFVSQSSFKAWNTRFAGRKAGSKRGCRSGKRYLKIKINSNHHAAHRLAFVIMGHEIDGFEVDHDDGNGLNNAWSNLSKASRTSNMRNIRRGINNTSGTTGVSWDSQKSSWVVQISANGKRMRIGFFKDKSEAIKARKEASKKYGYNKNHGSDRPL